MNVSLRKSNFLWKGIIIKIIILFTLIVFLNIFQIQIRNSFYFISSPISKVFLQSGSNTFNFFSSFLSFSDLKKENNNLKEENQELLYQISILQSSLIQSHVSAEALQNTQNDKFKILPVKVVGLNLENDSILINKGLDSGIKENMPIISSQKVIYGKVTKVYNNFSLVMLISSRGSVLDVKVLQSQNSGAIKAPVHGAIRGLGGLSFYLDLINSDSEIKEGDILTTSALEGIFPADLLVGKIKSVNKDDLKPFQTADMQPFLDIKSNDNLFLIIDYQKTN